MSAVKDAGNVGRCRDGEMLKTSVEFGAAGQRLASEMAVIKRIEDRMRGLAMELEAARGRSLDAIRDATCAFYSMTREGGQ